VCSSDLHAAASAGRLGTKGDEKAAKDGISIALLSILLIDIMKFY